MLILWFIVSNCSNATSQCECGKCAVQPRSDISSWHCCVPIKGYHPSVDFLLDTVSSTVNIASSLYRYSIVIDQVYVVRPENNVSNQIIKAHDYADVGCRNGARYS